MNSALSFDFTDFTTTPTLPKHQTPKTPLYTPSPPPRHNRNPHSHLDTPEKARIKTALTLLDHDEFKSDIFREFNISRTTGYRILREPEERDWRTFHNIPGGHETRGRKRKLSDDDDVQTLVRWIRANRWKPDGRKPGYAALPAAAGLDVECNGETVRRALKRSRKFSAHFFHASPLARKRLNCWGVPRCWGAGKQPPGSKRRS